MQNRNPSGNGFNQVRKSPCSFPGSDRSPKSEKIPRPLPTRGEEERRSQGNQAEGNTKKDIAFQADRLEGFDCFPPWPGPGQGELPGKSQRFAPPSGTFTRIGGNFAEKTERQKRMTII
jgi:hypothetical protein